MSTGAQPLRELCMPITALPSYCASVLHVASPLAITRRQILDEREYRLHVIDVLKYKANAVHQDWRLATFNGSFRVAEALSKKPSDRGHFDAMVVQQLNDEADCTARA